MSMDAPPISILVVEDDENDATLLRLAVEREQINNPIQFVSNGQEAIRYLQGEGAYADRSKAPFPDVIITDLKMPVLDGFDVLKKIKENPAWSVLPTIVLSSSAESADIQKSYRMGANAYLVKPDTLQELRKLLRTARDFWSSCARPAPHP